MSEAPRDGFRLARWTVTSGSSVSSRAAVVLHGAGHDWQASAEGNGAVDALLRAVNLALADVLGGDPQLLAFDIHALAEGPDAEGRVTVQIAPPSGPSSDPGAVPARFTGEVASTNVVAASVEAYVVAIDAMLAEGAWASAAAAAAARRDPAAAGEADEADAEYLHGRTIDTTAWFNR